MKGLPRRNVDARVISYAIQIIRNESKSPEVSQVFQACAASALQAASGLVALTIACKAAASSSAVRSNIGSNAEKDRFRILMESVGYSLEQSWTAEMKELFELLIVLAIEHSPMDEQIRLRTWSQGLFLDTRGIEADETEDVVADVELDDGFEDKPKRVRKLKKSKEIYDSQRLENLVYKAVAMGAKDLEPIFANNQVVIMGETSKGRKQIIRIRGSLNEASSLCEKANEEIRSLLIADSFQ
jgi:hypothetical protein